MIVRKLLLIRRNLRTMLRRIFAEDPLWLYASVYSYHPVQCTTVNKTVLLYYPNPAQSEFISTIIRDEYVDVLCILPS